MLLHHNLEDPVIIHLHHNQLLALDSAVQVQVGNLHVRLAFRQAHFEQPGDGHAPLQTSVQLMSTTILCLAKSVKSDLNTMNMRTTLPYFQVVKKLFRNLKG